MHISSSSGKKNRSVGFTLMNAESSRSHSVFQIIVESSSQREASGVCVRVCVCVCVFVCITLHYIILYTQWLRLL